MASTWRSVRPRSSLGQALAIEVENDLSSLAPGVQIFAGFDAGAGCADDANDGVEIVERNLVAFEDVFTLAGLAQQEGGAALHDFDAVIDECADCFVESEFLRLSIKDGQKDHGEALLHLGVLVELVEDNLWLRAALQLDYDAHAVAIAFITHVADVVDDLFIDQFGNALDEPGFVDLIRNLGDDDRLFFLGQIFRGHLGAHHEASAACFVCLGDARFSVEEAARGEVGTLHVLQYFDQAAFGILHQLDGGVDHFGEIVRRNVGGHADSDAARSVDDEIGDSRGQHRWLERGLVVVWREVDGFHLDVGQQLA